MTTENTPTPKKPRKNIDWEAVERDYRTGAFSLRELGEKHGADASLILRKARKNGWKKDLTKAIRHATNAMLVSGDGQQSQQQINSVDRSEIGAVHATAALNKSIIMGHRASLGRIARVQEMLLTNIEKDVEKLAGETPSVSRKELIQDFGKVVEINERWRKGEREAFGLNDSLEEDGAGSEKELTDAERAVRLAAIFSQNMG